MNGETQADEHVGYDRTLIVLSDMALDHLIGKGLKQYAPLVAFKGTKDLFPLLPARTKGTVKELHTKAMMDAAYDAIIHTGGAKFADLEAIAAGETTSVQVKHATESANGYALVSGIHPDSDAWHVIHLHRLGWTQEGEEYQAPLFALVPPMTFTAENTGWSEGVGHYVHIPMREGAKSRYAYVRDYVHTLAEAEARLSRGL